MKNDDFGDRMKMLEKVEAGRKFIPLLPICIRLDGRGFSKFTKNFERPYDIGMSDLMKATTMYLVEETNAVMGYTQSDEISLILYSDNYKSSVFFDGKIQKIISTLSAMTSVYFNRFMSLYIPDAPDTLPTFDCRAWNVPTKTEASNTLLWREQDAAKNSVSMAARSVFSHKEIMNKNGSQMQEMLMSKGINWNDYPTFFKRGSFFQRVKTTRKFTEEELLNLPEKHEARNNPDLVIERTDIREIDMPIFSSVTNRNEVVFDGEVPKVQRGFTPRTKVSIRSKVRIFDNE